MAKRVIDVKAIARDEDRFGNNAAFTCPRCGKVFLVAQPMHKEGRPCPWCQQSTGFAPISNEDQDGAHIKWDRNDRFW